MATDYPVPENEAERVKIVRSLGLLNTPPEERFDRYTRFARELMGVPVAFVSIIGEDTQWFKSAQGMELSQSPRETSFCTHTIAEGDMMIINDALKDERFAKNPFVTNPPYIRFYAGITLKLKGDISVGTLCVCDTKPRYPDEVDINNLVELAHLLEDEFETHAQSTSDPLTGLSNRRGLTTIGGHVLAMCKRAEKSATLLHLKLTSFVDVNEDLGRDKGDAVLKNIAQLLLNEFRHSDVVARVGASEFFVLLTGTSRSALAKPMKTLEKALHEENMNLPFDLTYKVGAVEWKENIHTDITALMAAADEIMSQGNSK